MDSLNVRKAPEAVRTPNVLPTDGTATATTRAKILPLPLTWWCLESAWAASPALDEFDVAPQAAVTRLAWHVYYTFLRVLPAAARRWWIDCSERALHLAVEKFVARPRLPHAHQH